MDEKTQKQAVLVFSTAYFPFVGGAEVAIREVARRLSPKFDFFIITSRFKRNLPKIEKVKEGTIVRLGFGNILDKYFLPVLGVLWALRKEGMLFGLDISAGSFAPAFLKFLFPKRFFVLNIQYGYGDERLAKGRAGLIGTAFRFMLSQADAVASISNYLLDTAKDYGYKGHSAIIPNGIDLKNFQISNFQKKQKTIITTSRLVIKNGVDILIEAIAVVKEKVPDIKCLILGEGPEEASLKNLATELNISQNIKFLGTIGQEKIPRYLAESNIFVRPSRSEGLGISFLEAIAAGLPIIAPPVGGIPDIIEDGKTGLFCNPEDPKDLAEKIMNLLENEPLAKSIVENGQKMIKEKFLWEKISENYENLFNLKNSKRVLICTGIFPPDIGGPATYSKVLLDELPKRGINVNVLSFGSVRHLPNFIRHLVYGLRILTYGRSSDIIFAQDPFSVGFPAAAAAFILRKKFLLKVVGDYAWEQHQQRSGSVFFTPDDFQVKTFDFFTEFQRKIQKFVAKRAKLIITPSDYLKKIVGMWGINKDKIKVIYNSFAAPRDGASLALNGRELAKKELGLSGSVLVSAGRNVPWKGFQALRDLMPEVTRRFSDAKLFVFHNEPRENLFLYLRAADAFVLNTAYEGFSHQILEAMALGVPVITTNIGGNPEIVRNGENGFLVAYNDKEAFRAKITEILENKNLAEDFSKKARVSAQQFTKDRMINGIVDVIKTL